MFKFYLLSAVILFLNTGCNIQETHISSCDTNILTHSDFADDPLFSALHFHKHLEMDDSLYIPKGYDLWADSKFEYQSALQFSFIYKDKNTNHHFCVNSVLLRLKLPLSSDQKNLLASFSDKISDRANLNAGVIQKALANLPLNNEPVKTIAKNDQVVIKAGVAHHQFRGDFLIVNMEIAT